MKHLLTQCAAAGVLLLSVPMAAGAASTQKAAGSAVSMTLALVVIGVVLALLVARQACMHRDKPAPLAPGERRDYGSAGGAVCRKCGLPFARNALDLNMLIGTLVRCPHCGKWAKVTTAASITPAPTPVMQPIATPQPVTIATPTATAAPTATAQPTAEVGLERTPTFTPHGDPLLPEPC